MELSSEPPAKKRRGRPRKDPIGWNALPPPPSLRDDSVRLSQPQSLGAPPARPSQPSWAVSTLVAPSPPQPMPTAAAATAVTVATEPAAYANPAVSMDALPAVAEAATHPAVAEPVDAAATVAIAALPDIAELDGDALTVVPAVVPAAVVASAHPATVATTWLGRSRNYGAIQFDAPAPLPPPRPLRPSAPPPPWLADPLPRRQVLTRPAPPPLPLPWQCVACTWRNSHAACDLLSCEACGTPKPTPSPHPSSHASPHAALSAPSAAQSAAPSAAPCVAPAYVHTAVTQPAQAPRVNERQTANWFCPACRGKKKAHRCGQARAYETDQVAIARSLLNMAHGMLHDAAVRGKSAADIALLRKEHAKAAATFAQVRVSACPACRGKHRAHTCL